MSKEIDRENEQQAGLETISAHKEGGVLFAESPLHQNLIGPELVRDLVAVIQHAEADDSLQALVFKSSAGGRLPSRFEPLP